MAASFRLRLIRPPDPDRCARLAKKNDEYRERLRAFEAALVHGVMPFTVTDAIRHYRYRIAMLEAVLDGVAEINELFVRLNREDELHTGDMPSFIGAWLLIEDYVIHGGKHVTGGTGLPSP